MKKLKTALSLEIICCIIIFYLYYIGMYNLFTDIMVLILIDTLLTIYDRNRLKEYICLFYSFACYLPLIYLYYLNHINQTNIEYSMYIFYKHYDRIMLDIFVIVIVYSWYKKRKQIKSDK